MKLSTIWGAFARPFLKIAGGVFLSVLAVSVYYKAVKFLYTIPFPCDSYEAGYKVSITRYDCTSAEMLAMITSMLTIVAIIGYVIHDN